MCLSVCTEGFRSPKIVQNLRYQGPINHTSQAVDEIFVVQTNTFYIFCLEDKYVLSVLLLITDLSNLLIISVILRDTTTDNKLIYIPNDNK